MRSLVAPVNVQMDLSASARLGLTIRTVDLDSG